jgi:hypothetical protein
MYVAFTRTKMLAYTHQHRDDDGEYSVREISQTLGVCGLVRHYGSGPVSSRPAVSVYAPESMRSVRPRAAPLAGSAHSASNCRSLRWGEGRSARAAP